MKADKSGSIQRATKQWRCRSENCGHIPATGVECSKSFGQTCSGVRLPGLGLATLFGH